MQSPEQVRDESIRANLQYLLNHCSAQIRRYKGNPVYVSISEYDPVVVQKVIEDLTASGWSGKIMKTGWIFKKEVLEITAADKPSPAR